VAHRSGLVEKVALVIARSAKRDVAISVPFAPQLTEIASSSEADFSQ
jgi:hypothetical protein